MISEASVIVAGERLWLTEHAVDRYRQRVRSTLSERAVIEELRQVLPHARLVVGDPSWCSPEAMDGTRADRWLVLLDDIVFPIQSSRILTCMVRGLVEGDRLEERREARRDRAAKRRARRHGGRDSFGGHSGMRKLIERERRNEKRDVA